MLWSLYVVSLNKLLNKQSNCQWFETPLRAFNITRIKTISVMTRSCIRGFFSVNQNIFLLVSDHYSRNLEKWWPQTWHTNVSLPTSDYLFDFNLIKRCGFLPLPLECFERLALDWKVSAIHLKYMDTIPWNIWIPFTWNIWIPFHEIYGYPILKWFTGTWHIKAETKCPQFYKWYLQCVSIWMTTFNNVMKFHWNMSLGV